MTGKSASFARKQKQNTHKKKKKREKKKEIAKNTVGSYGGAGEIFKEK